MKTLLFLTVMLCFFGCSASRLNNINQSESKPVLIKSSPINYPELAKKKGIEGAVELFILVDKSGSVLDSRIIKKSKSILLDSAAVQYSRNLVFAPIIENNSPVEKWIWWKVRFELEYPEDLAASIKKIKLLVISNTDTKEKNTADLTIKMLKHLADNFRFKIDVTQNPDYLSTGKLSDYNVILFANSLYSGLNEIQKDALVNFVNRGGGFVGIHSAIQNETDWEWYSKLIGNKYKKLGGLRNSVINVVDKNHISTKHLPYYWQWTDRWYEWLNQFDRSTRVLAIVENKESEIGKTPDFIPVIWCHQFEGGRSWYSSLGHLAENYSDPDFEKLILGGILWASGVIK